MREGRGFYIWKKATFFSFSFFEGGEIGGGSFSFFYIYPLTGAFKKMQLRYIFINLHIHTHTHINFTHTH